MASLWSSQFLDRKTLWSIKTILKGIKDNKFCLLYHPDAINDFCCCSHSRFFWTPCKYIWHVSNPQYLRIWKQNLQNNSCKYDLVCSNKILPDAWSRTGQHHRPVSAVLPHGHPQPAQTRPLDWIVHCQCGCLNSLSKSYLSFTSVVTLSLKLAQKKCLINVTHIWFFDTIATDHLLGAACGYKIGLYTLMS